MIERGQGERAGLCTGTGRVLALLASVLALGACNTTTGATSGGVTLTPPQQVAIRPNVVAVDAAMAQKLSQQDLLVHSSTAAVLLNGSTLSNQGWNNPALNSSGILTVQRRFQNAGRPCAELQQVVNNGAETLFVTTVYCQAQTGDWVIEP